MKPSIDGYNVVDQLPDNLPAVRYPRTPGSRPSPEENKHNAWYYKTRIEGAAQGKLKGKRVVVKDNVMVAGVPIYMDPKCPEGQFIFLNTRYLSFYIHEAAAFVFTGFASTLPKYARYTPLPSNSL